MPYAICQSCGQSTHYRNTRGTRLASMQCSCGGVLKSRAPSGGGANQGKKLSTCAICGKGTYRERPIDVAVRSRLECQATYPPGAIICWRHDGELLPATHPYFSLVDTPITREYLLWMVGAFAEWCASLLDDHPDAAFYLNEVVPHLIREAEKVDDNKIDYNAQVLRNGIVDFCMVPLNRVSL